MRNIVLVGMMGSGKTSIGKALSEKLGLRFTDTDVEVEKKNKMKINKIFEMFGEMGFRTIEEEIVDELQRAQSRVIATGGGTLMSAKNFNTLKRRGCLIYLKTSSETIYNRLKNDKTRPLLKANNSQEKISELIEKRAPIYEKACLTICTDNKGLDDITAEILEQLEEYEL